MAWKMPLGRQALQIPACTTKVCRNMHEVRLNGQGVWEIEPWQRSIWSKQRNGPGIQPCGFSEDSPTARSLSQCSACLKGGAARATHERATSGFHKAPRPQDTQPYSRPTIVEQCRVMWKTVLLTCRGVTSSARKMMPIQTTRAFFAVPSTWQQYPQIQVNQILLPMRRCTVQQRRLLDPRYLQYCRSHDGSMRCPD